MNNRKFALVVTLTLLTFNAFAVTEGMPDGDSGGKDIEIEMKLRQKVELARHQYAQWKEDNGKHIEISQAFKKLYREIKQKDSEPYKLLMEKQAYCEMDKAHCAERMEDVLRYFIREALAPIEGAVFYNGACNINSQTTNLQCGLEASNVNPEMTLSSAHAYVCASNKGNMNAGKFSAERSNFMGFNVALLYGGNGVCILVSGGNTGLGADSGTAVLNSNYF